MPSDQPATTIRLTDEDKGIIDRLRKMTGLTSATAIIKLAIRESLAARQAKRSK
jgi:predicted DNA-binding protein